MLQTEVTGLTQEEAAPSPWPLTSQRKCFRPSAQCPRAEGLELAQCGQVAVCLCDRRCVCAFIHFYNLTSSQYIQHVLSMIDKRRENVLMATNLVRLRKTFIMSIVLIYLIDFHRLKISGDLPDLVWGILHVAHSQCQRHTFQVLEAAKQDSINRKRRLIYLMMSPVNTTQDKPAVKVRILFSLLEIGLWFSHLQNQTFGHRCTSDYIAAALTTYSVYHASIWNMNWLISLWIQTYSVLDEVALVSVVSVDVFPSWIHIAVLPCAPVLCTGILVEVRAMTMSGNHTTTLTSIWRDSNGERQRFKKVYWHAWIKVLWHSGACDNFWDWAGF